MKRTKAEAEGRIIEFVCLMVGLTWMGVEWIIIAMDNWTKLGGMMVFFLIGVAGFAKLVNLVTEWKEAE